MQFRQLVASQLAILLAVAAADSSSLAVTTTSTSSTSTSTSSTSKTTSKTSSSTTTSKTTSTSDNLPGLTTTASSSTASSSSVHVSSSSVVVTSGSSTYTSVSYSTSSLSSSSTSYTFKASIPTSNITNPYIQRESTAPGTVFYSVGSILAAMLVGFFAFGTLSFIFSRMRKSSQTDDLFSDYDEKQFAYDPSIFGKGTYINDNSSTVFGYEDSKSNYLKNSSQSVYSFGPESTLGSTFLLLNGSSVDENFPGGSNQQGKSLRNALLNPAHNGSQSTQTGAGTGPALGASNNNNNSNSNKQHVKRKSRAISMYLSPMELAMQQSQLGLQPPGTSYDPNASSISSSPVTPLFASSPVDNSFSINSDTNNSNRDANKRLTGLDWYALYQLSQEEQTVPKLEAKKDEPKKQPPKIRPPSLYLDELMNASTESDDEK